MSRAPSYEPENETYKIRFSDRFVMFAWYLGQRCAVCPSTTQRRTKQTLAVGMAHTHQGSEEGDRSLYDSSESKRCDEMNQAC